MVKRNDTASIKRYFYTFKFKQFLINKLHNSLWTKEA